MLLSCVLTYIVDAVSSLEDISSEAARRLLILLKMVDDKAASFYSSDKEGNAPQDKAAVTVQLNRYVAKYRRMVELQMVLTGSLQEIADRWSEGAGPLATEFTPSEIKQLIRALFQNTDRRAAVLSKIK